MGDRCDRSCPHPFFNPGISVVVAQTRVPYKLGFQEIALHEPANAGTNKTCTTWQYDVPAVAALATAGIDGVASENRAVIGRNLVT